MTAAQRYGNAFHALAQELVRTLDVDAAAIAERFELLPSEARRLDGAREQILDVLRGDIGENREAEVAFVYAMTASTIRRPADRKDRGPGEVYGAADLVFERADGWL